MESFRFDELTKILATAASRRQALKTIAATTLGSILGLGGIGTALASCKPNGIGCNTNSQCCSGGCCHGTCTNLNTTSNCGACGHKCDACSTCQSGTCVSRCSSGQVCLCNGTCATACVPDYHACPGVGICYFDIDQTHIYCINENGSGGGTRCASDCDCPVGNFCEGPGATGFCTPVK